MWMKCKNCGGQIEVVPENGNCPNCGHCLIDIRLYPTPPFLMKKVRYGYLEFEEHGVRLHTRLPKAPLKDIFTPYTEIFDTSFVPATRWLIGFLCIRSVKEKHIPLPRTFWEKRNTDSLIWFEIHENVEFNKAYEFLKQCADINEKVRNE